MHTTLIEPAELAAHCKDADWVLLDCRFDLGRPDWGRAAYSGGHIAGAQYVDLERDLSGARGPATGRHPLPDRSTLADRLGRFGIDEHVQVVAYDQANGAYAARAWWLLRWLGHPAVAVLNGGLAAWQQAGLPLEQESVTRPHRSFTSRPSLAQVTSTVELEAAVSSRAGGTALPLVDARSAERFAGRNETLDPVAGHVPGALNHPFTENLDAQGRFLPAAELAARWRARLGTLAPAEVTCMCGSGVTACHNLLALEIAQLRGARLYPGSWSEWIRDPRRQVAQG